jgi:hypothetical protein
MHLLLNRSADCPVANRRLQIVPRCLCTVDLTHWTALHLPANSSSEHSRTWRHCDLFASTPRDARSARSDMRVPRRRRAFYEKPSSHVNTIPAAFPLSSYSWSAARPPPDDRHRTSMETPLNRPSCRSALLHKRLQRSVMQPPPSLHSPTPPCPAALRQPEGGFT